MMNEKIVSRPRKKPLGLVRKSLGTSLRLRLVSTIVFLLLSIITAACGSDSGSQSATAEALGQSLVQTATAQAETVVDQGDVVATTEAEATAQGQVVEVTRAAEATAVAVDAAITATAITPIEAELRSYGIDPTQGKIGWIHPPFTLEVEGYLQYGYDNAFIETVAADFVVAADITWNTQYGSTGCGFVVRSDGNEEAFNQYLIIATRGAEGHVGFIVQEDGEVNIDASTDIYANGIDPLFEWQNDTTNRIVVVGRGDLFEIFTNGTKIGEITTEAGFEKGFVAFVALNESGFTTCHYDDAWLWLLN